jgi:hypothetical protein
VRDLSHRCSSQVIGEGSSDRDGLIGSWRTQRSGGFVPEPVGAFAMNTGRECSKSRRPLSEEIRAFDRGSAVRKPFGWIVVTCESLPMKRGLRFTLRFGLPWWRAITWNRHERGPARGAW